MAHNLGAEHTFGQGQGGLMSYETEKAFFDNYAADDPNSPNYGMYTHMCIHINIHILYT